MAKLEFYRQQVVPRIATPSARGLAAVGAQAVRTAEAVTEGIAAVAKIASDMEDLRVEDQLNKVRSAQTELMMNPDTGFMSKRAGDAVSPDFMERYSKDFEKSIEGLAGELKGNRAQEKFRRRAEMMKAEYNDSLMRHVLGETKVYREVVYKGSKDQEVKFASMNFGDDAKISDSIARAISNSDMYAKQNGLPEKARQAMLLQDLSDIHTSVISAALDSNDSRRARDYFEKNKAQITPDKISEITNALKSGTDRDESLRLSLELSDRKIPFSQQRKELKSLFSTGKITAEVYDQTNQRIAANEALADKNRADYENSMSGRAQEWIINNPGKPLVDMPRNLYNFAVNKGVLATLENFSRSVENNYLPPGANELFTNLVIASSDEPEKFTKTFDQNIGIFRMQLSPSQFASLEAKRASLGKAAFAEAKKNTALDVAAKTVRGLRADLIAAGIDVTPIEGSKQAQTLSDFNAALIEQIQANSEALDRPVTMQEARKIGLGLLKEGKLIGAGFWGSDKEIRTFEVTPEQRQEFSFIQYTFDEIPPNEKKRLQDVILSRRDLREKLGIKSYNDGTFSRPSLERAVELLYQAELDGATY